MKTLFLILVALLAGFFYTCSKVADTAHAIADHRNAQIEQALKNSGV